MLQAVKNKILTMIQRALVTNSRNYTPGEYPKVQISSLGQTSDMELVAPYGIASMPPNGSSAVRFNMQGESSKQVGVAYDLKTLPPHNPGEVVIGAFSATIPTYLKFTQQGMLEVWKGGVLMIPDLITHGHTLVTAGDDISGGPTNPAATP